VGHRAAGGGATSQLAGPDRVQGGRGQPPAARVGDRGAGTAAFGGRPLVVRAGQAAHDDLSDGAAARHWARPALCRGVHRATECGGGGWHLRHRATLLWSARRRDRRVAVRCQPLGGGAVAQGVHRRPAGTNGCPAVRRAAGGSGGPAPLGLGVERRYFGRHAADYLLSGAVGAGAGDPSGGIPA